MCYLSEQSDPSPPPTGGLWSPQASDVDLSSKWSRPVSPSHSSTMGLWGGSCVDSGGLSPSGLRSGLVTPRYDDESPPPTNPAALPTSASGDRLSSLLPPSPPPSNNGIASLDEQLDLDAALEAEFNDHFVTQVYNYLSLGYPVIARDFDDELSKISRVPVQELRSDDHLAKARGYIRLGEGEAASEGVTEEMCSRWKALRLYVKEWARQHPQLNRPTGGEGNWMNARKHSWAW